MGKPHLKTQGSGRGPLTSFLFIATATCLIACGAALWPHFLQRYLNPFFMGQGQSSRGSEPVAWPPANNTLPIATFAGGCFWGMELKFQRVPGVQHTCVGYTGGSRPNPTYNAVCSGSTGHAEAVQLTFDPKEVSYQKLCELFFTFHDASTKNRQGGDVGTQYRSAIFFHDQDQKQVATSVASNQPQPTTQIAAAGQFYPAESYHQQYLEHGGRSGRSQCASKGCSDPVRCYG